MSVLQESQQRLTEYIRDPHNAEAPSGIEPRRLQIYSELFYNNIEGFLSSGFPVLRDIFSEQRWHAMVRDFMLKHRCHTPYFLEIAQEFILYLQQSRSLDPADPVYMQELAHYEWVELALDIAEDTVDHKVVDGMGDLLNGLPLVSSLAWSLCYQYPVHKIGPTSQPQLIEPQPNYLVVYRNSLDQVRFMETNATTARLLEILRSGTVDSGRSALLQLAEEMQHPHPETIVESGHETLRHLRQLDIIAGTALLD